jgi:hypothetical protein
MEVTSEFLESEFLESLQERADEKFNGHLHQAFIDWYVEAEFGGVDWRFTDGPNDGGIDAVVWRGGDDAPRVIVMQSKFTERIESKPLAAKAYREFREVVDAFYHRGQELDELLSRVRPELKQIYRKVIRLLDGNWLSEKKAFRCITTSKRAPRFEFDRVPKNNFVYGNDILRLYAQYRRVWTPKAPDLVLKVEDKLSYIDRRREGTSYLFNAYAADFRKYLEKTDVARLVARNIRYELGKSIGRQIRATYEDSPHDFWYFHNGITVVCDDFQERDRKATLTNPSVINGAQTLYAISHSSADTSPARVSTRVIVRHPGRGESAEDDLWLQKIIRAVNTQNRVLEPDFRSNEPEQVLLQQRFREMRVFYERKQGEWAEHRTDPKYKGFRKLTLAALGQILTAISDERGQGVILVKRGVEQIFRAPHYERLFPSRAKINFRFPRIYLAYSVAELLASSGYRSPKEYRRMRHAFWNTLWLVHRGLMSSGLFNAGVRADSLKRGFDRVEGARGRKGATQALRKVVKAVWSAWRTARKSNPEHWTPNNFFKNKYGNRKLLGLAYPKVSGDLRALARQIAKTA